MVTNPRINLLIGKICKKGRLINSNGFECYYLRPESTIFTDITNPYAAHLVVYVYRKGSYQFPFLRLITSKGIIPLSRRKIQSHELSKDVYDSLKFVNKISKLDVILHYGEIALCVSDRYSLTFMHTNGMIKMSFIETRFLKLRDTKKYAILKNDECKNEVLKTMLRFITTYKGYVNDMAQLARDLIKEYLGKEVKIG